MFYVLVFGHNAGGVLAPQPGMEPAPPALEGEVLTTGPPGKSQECSVLLACLSPVLKSGFPLPPSLFFTSLDGRVYWRIKQNVCASQAARVALVVKTCLLVWETQETQVWWVPGSGRSPGGGHGNPLQYSRLEDPLDREAWRAADLGLAKSRARSSDWAE